MPLPPHIEEQAIAEVERRKGELSRRLASGGELHFPLELHNPYGDAGRLTYLEPWLLSITSQPLRAYVTKYYRDDFSTLVITDQH